MGPQAAVRLVRAGHGAPEYLASVRQATTTLAMLGADETAIAEALTHFEETAMGGGRALSHLLMAVRLEVSHAFQDLERSERRLIERIRRADRIAATSAEFQAGVRDALKEHFGATDAAIGRGAAGDHWTVPFDIFEVQLVFPTRRRMLRREQRLLRHLAEEFASPAARLARAATELAEIERARFSRELHDGPAQALALLRLQLEMHDSGSAEVAESTGAAISRVRQLMGELGRSLPERDGLAPAIQKILDRLEAEQGIRGQIHTEQLPEMHPWLQVAVYRITQECLSNVARHSSANLVEIFLGCTDTLLSVCVEDNGRGFDVDEAMARPRCFGLAAIRARAQLLGGSVSLESKARNSAERARKGGTKVVIRLPLFREFPVDAFM